MTTCEVCGKEGENIKDFRSGGIPIYQGNNYPEDGYEWTRKIVCWSCIYKLKVVHHVCDELGETFTMYKDWKNMQIITCTGQNGEGCYSEHFVDETTTWPFKCRCGTLTNKVK